MSGPKTESTEQNDKERIFVSYSSRDSRFVHRFVKQLESYGAPCWLYERDALPGISYLQQTGQGIADSVAVLLIVSKASLDSDSGQITKEVVRAHEERRPIIPLLLDVDHEVFRASQPEWREAIGAYVSISLRDSTISNACRLIAIALDRIREANCATTESPLFSPHLCKAFDALNQTIEALTAEQLRVLNLLGYSKRVRISGCAGSGKTLVAVEKASRLDTAGLRVAVLCHSPYLARYLSTLLLGTQVEVESFDQWLRRYLNAGQHIPEVRWTHTHEPSVGEINAAFDAIVSSQNLYDAIIVDEAQDFRPEWWILIEAALSPKSSGILYIFHDDKQKLDRKYIPEYPINEPHLDLSRNIRNAGNVYKVVKFYNRASPPIDEELWGMGNAVVLDLPFSDTGLCLQIALCRVSQHCPRASRLLLIYPEATISRLDMRPSKPYEVAAAWQEAIFVHLLKIIESEQSFDESQKQLWQHRLYETCSAMSLGSDVTPEDVRLVNRFVASLSLQGHNPSNVRWAVYDHQLQVRTGSTGPEHFRRCLGLFRRPNWHKTIPTAHFGFLPAEVIIATPGSAKGLEADVAVMLVERYDAYTETEYYIAISRPRHSLFVVLAGKDASLPRGSRENLVDYYRRIPIRE